MRLCWQMLAPLQSLHSLLRRLCSQMPAPPQSLDLLLCRLCSHFLRPLCGALTRCVCLPPSKQSHRRVVGLLPRFLLAALAALAPLLPVPAHLLPRPFVQLGPFATRTMTARPRQESPSVQDPVSLGRPVVRFKGAVTPAVAGRP
jgi:hypothetical protein